MILEIDGWKFQVFDVTTRKYYAREVADHCTCATCRNFYQTVDQVYPELRPFLARFGVHVEAPEEMMTPIQTICDCYYTVCGKILEAGEEPIAVGNRSIAVFFTSSLTAVEADFAAFFDTLSSHFTIRPPVRSVHMRSQVRNDSLTT